MAENEPKKIVVRGANVHNLKISMWMCHYIRSLGLQVCPVRANHHLRLACCMLRVPDDIWNRCRLIQGGG